ncbi:MAG: RNA polymerase sigma factor RpoD/SigA [Treponema sp.]|nr:RNA polymerase sigma factor RpoD/SigA [Treponema sp.]
MNKKTTGKSAKSNMALYFDEINQIPILTREQEEEAAREASKGNTAAREKLINANLRFVVSIAKKYQGFGMPLEDLISEGNIGLLSAVDRFDVEKGYHFISYAVWWIRQAIMSALYEKSRMIRLPVNRATELVKIEKTRKMLRGNYSFGEEINEITKLLNMDKDHVYNLLNLSRDMISLDVPVSDDKALRLKDSIEDYTHLSPDAFVEIKSMENDIEEILSTLKDDEAYVIRWHFGLGQRTPMSLREIGERCNLSKERIRQIEEKALSRLRNPKRKKLLQVYVA